MKNSIYVLIFILISCQNKKNPEIVSLLANAETSPVISEDDAADDPCIWIHASNASASKIIGTDKKNGLVVYNLQGEIVSEYPFGRLNNVDIRTRIQLGDSIVTIVGASNRSLNTLAIFSWNENSEKLESILKEDLKSNLQEVYGFCLYYNSKEKELFSFVVGKDGNVEQWQLRLVNAKIEGEIVRTFSVGSISEGMVADDYHNNLYLAEENVALYKYSALKNADSSRTKLISVHDKNMRDDFEGVTLYDQGEGKGYIIVSSQGNNSYAVFDRETNNYLKSFSIGDSEEIDGTYDTDGIDVTAAFLGKEYPEGVFIAQDGANTQGKDTLTQNFKIVDWRRIKNILD
ncbi:phytase [Flavicella sediminum]|uniref:phytase n=1 Tax=Flavicella sediminum TaxID=2585141 RepID=UPI00111CBC52|nr:phytase [Flavicella sediminum]